MNSVKKYKKCTTIIIFTLFIILTLKIYFSNDDINMKSNLETNNYIEKNLDEKPENNYEKYLKESEIAPYEEIEYFFKDTTDKVVVYVNGDLITEREIALVDLNNNNNYIKNYTEINQDEGNVDPVKIAIQEKIICQEAERLGLFVSEEQIKEIKEVPNYEEDIKKMAESANMDYSEYEELYIKSQKQFFLKAKWREYVIPKLHTGEISVDTKEFNNKYLECQKYIESSNFEKYMDTASELLTLYKQYLVEQAKIEYVN